MTDSAPDIECVHLGYFQLLIICGMYSHLDRVFLMIVNKGDSLVVALNAVDCYTHLPVPIEPLHDDNMIDSFSVSVVYLERFPISGEAWCKTQFVFFKPQPQK